MSCNQGNINYARFILLMHDHADQLSCIRLNSIHYCGGLQVSIRLFTFLSQGHCNLLHSDHYNNWVSIYQYFWGQNQYSVFLSQFQYKILMNQYSWRHWDMMIEDLGEHTTGN